MTGLPIDPDVTAEESASVAAHAVAVLRHRWDVLAVIGLGGALGSGARYGVGELIPHASDQIAWSTLVVNVLGCALLGVLMVFVIDVWRPGRYLRPFWGVGVLGGFTTFSTYVVDARALLAAGHPARAAAYGIGSVVLGLLAVWLGIVVTRALVGGRR